MKYTPNNIHSSAAWWLRLSRMKYLLLTLVLTACLPYPSGDSSRGIANSPAFGYSGAITAQVGIAIPDSALEAADGFALSDYTYTISPELNAGLLFSATDGAISGTPTAVQPETEYVVTAWPLRGKGATTTTLLIAIGKGPLPTATITLEYEDTPTVKLKVILSEKPDTLASNYPMVKDYRLQYRRQDSSAGWGEWTNTPTIFPLSAALDSFEEIRDTAMLPANELERGEYSYRLLSAVRDQYSDNYESTGGDWLGLRLPAATSRRLVAVFREANLLGLALDDAALATPEPAVNSYKVQFQKDGGAWVDTRLSFASTDAVGTVVVLTDTASADMVPDSAGDVAIYKYRLVTVPAERRTHTPDYSAEAAPGVAPSISYAAGSVVGKFHNAKIQDEVSIAASEMPVAYTASGAAGADKSAYTYKLLDSTGADSSVLTMSANGDILAGGSPSSPLTVGTYTVRATPIATPQPGSKIGALAGGQLQAEIEVFDKLKYTIHYANVPEQMKSIGGRSKLLKNVNFSGSTVSVRAGTKNVPAYHYTWDISGPSSGITRVGVNANTGNLLSKDGSGTPFKVGDWTIRARPVVRAASDKELASGPLTTTVTVLAGDKVIGSASGDLAKNAPNAGTIILKATSNGLGLADLIRHYSWDPSMVSWDISGPGQWISIDEYGVLSGDGSTSEPDGSPNTFGVGTQIFRGVPRTEAGVPDEVIVSGTLLISVEVITP